MPGTYSAGERVAGAPATVYTGAGRLMAILVSHDQSTVQGVTVTDGASTILQLYIDPTRSPVFLDLAHRDKMQGLPFNSSLTITPGSCEVNVWFLGY